MQEELIPGASPDTGPEQKEKRKVSKSESGHAIIVANFEDLTSICTGFGPAYNPAKDAIKIASLISKRTAALDSLKSIDDLLPAYINAVNNREIIFLPFESLIRRINNAVAASDVTPQFIKDIRTITRKLLGESANPKHINNKETLQLSEGDAMERHSSSQTSMDARIENFYKLIQLLASDPNYQPNEADLTIAALTTLHTSMIASNTIVINTLVPLANARLLRNQLLYHPATGLVKTANDVKKYVKSVFGVSSPQYKQLSRLQFKGGSDLANKLK